MAEIPVFRRRGQLPGAPALRPATASGTAAGALGNVDTGGVMKMLDGIQRSKEAAWISRATGEAEIWAAEEERRLEGESEEGAPGHVQAWRSSWNGYASEALKAAPSGRAREALARQLQNIEVSAVKRRGVFQARADLAKRGSDFEQGAQLNAFAARQNPDRVFDILLRSEAQIEEAATWLPAPQLTATRDAATAAIIDNAVDGYIEREDFGGALALLSDDALGGMLNADARSAALDKVERAREDVFVRDEGAAIGNAAAAGAAGGMDDWKSAISGIESSGEENPYGAIGPEVKGGRAYGKYQVMGFNVGPWTKKYFGRELTPQEFLDNPDAQEAVFEGEFGRLVKKYGNPQDAASVWFSGRPLGEGGNPSDGFTSRDDYVAAFTAGLEGAASSGVTADEIIAGSVRDIDDPGLRDRVMREAGATYALATASDARLKAEAKMQNERVFALLQVAVDGNEASYGDIDKAYSMGEITPAQWSQLRRAKNDAVSRAAKEGADLNAGVAKWSSGEAFSVYDSNDRKMAELLFAQTEQDEAAAMAIAGRTGIIPKSEISDLRMRMDAGEQGAYEYAENLRQAAPSGFNVESGDTNKRLDHYRGLIDAGYPPSEAARRASRSDEEKAAIAIPQAEARKEYGKLDIGDVRSDVGVNGWFEDMHPRREGRLMAQYEVAYTEARTDGMKASEARAYAGAKLGRLWGATSLNDDDADQVMHLPPEMTYPAGPDAIGHSYVKEQAISTVERETGAKPQKIFFQSDRTTEADWRAGLPPRYRVFYTDSEGRYQMMPDYFRADPRGALDAGRILARTEFEEADEVARAKQQEIEALEAGPVVTP